MQKQVVLRLMHLFVTLSVALSISSCLSHIKNKGDISDGSTPTNDDEGIESGISDYGTGSVEDDADHKVDGNNGIDAGVTIPDDVGSGNETPEASGPYLLEIGESCSSNSECLSGYCTDAVCCDSACDGVCQRCDGNDATGLIGYCSPIKRGEDPDDECDKDEPLSCGFTGACDVHEACEYYGKEISCGDDSFCNRNGECVRFWTKQIGTPELDHVGAIAADSEDNVYLTGLTEGDLDGNSNAGAYDLFVVKYDSDGIEQWVRQLGSSNYDYGKSIATGSRGDVYVTGYTLGNLDGNSNAGGYDLFVVKYNSAGVKQWTRQLGSSDYDFVSDIAVNSRDEVYVTGNTSGDLDGNTNAGGIDLIVVMYNSAGVKQWTRQLGSSADDAGSGIAVDSNGNVYVTGSTEGGLDGHATAGNKDVIIVKYNSEGVKQWSRQFGAIDTDRGTDIATDGNGNIYLTGYGNLDGYISVGAEDLFVVKHDSDGVKQWTRQFGSYGFDNSNSIAVDGLNDIYVTGDTKGNLDGNTSAGDTDAFIVKYDSEGTKQWTKQFGTSDYVSGKAIATDSNHSIYVAGNTNGSLDGNSNAGDVDLFVVKYNSDGIQL